VLPPRLSSEAEAVQSLAMFPIPGVSEKPPQVWQMMVALPFCSWRHKGWRGCGGMGVSDAGNGRPS
jgi:hypothetical protein